MGQHQQDHPLYGQNWHAPDQLLDQLLRGDDPRRNVGLQVRRAVPERRRGADMGQLFEVHQPFGDLAGRRPALPRPERRRIRQQRQQHDLRPRRPGEDRQHHAPLQLQHPGRRALERHRHQHDVAGRRQTRLVSGQGVGLFLGTVRPPVQHGTPVALQRPLGHRPTAAPTGRAWSAIRPATRA